MTTAHPTGHDDPAGLLAAALSRDPGRPLITFYDDARGERAELSVATFANWVAKTANFLRDGLGATPGDRVAIDLPAHWQSAVWLAACWASGTIAVPGAAEAVTEGAQIIVVRRDGARPAPGADEVVVLGLGPLGLPVRGASNPPGWVDYDVEIHSYGDRFAPGPLGSLDRPALDLAGSTFTARALVAEARRAATEWVLPADPAAPATPTDRARRLLATEPLATLPAVLATLLVPLVAHVGVVLCRHLELDRVAARAKAEHVVAVAPGTALPPAYLPGVTRL